MEFTSFFILQILYSVECLNLDRKEEVVAMLWRGLIAIPSYKGKGQHPCVEKKASMDCKFCIL